MPFSEKCQFEWRRAAHQSGVFRRSDELDRIVWEVCRLTVLPTFSTVGFDILNGNGYEPVHDGSRIPIGSTNNFSEPFPEPPFSGSDPKPRSSQIPQHHRTPRSKGIYSPIGAVRVPFFGTFTAPRIGTYGDAVKSWNLPPLGRSLR